jgi:LysR family hydrogen peroxide-inducible transcriptional activator
MDLKALRYFVAAVEAGSITGASERCFIAQPSITAAIQKLEEQLETKLLIRQKRGVSVTPEGSELYTTAKSLLQHAASIEQRFKAKQERRVLTISVPHSVSFNYLETLLQHLKQHTPNIQVKLIRGDASPEDSVDIRLTMDQRIQDDEEFIPCWRDRYCLITPKDHPLAYAEKINASDFNGMPFILRTFCDRNQEMMNFLEQLDISMEFVAEVDNEEWALSLVSSGLGLAIVPLPMDVEFSDRFFIKPLEQIEGVQGFERAIGVAIRYRQYSNPYFQQLANYLKQTMQEGKH